ncbi:MAG: hypothetical protein GXO90_03220, partial [FCB group bacterium]|nr:hypothetical protein [FCB group bacterium]
LKQGLSQPETVIDLSRIQDLNKIERQDDYIHIGALVSLSTIVEHPTIREYFPLIREAAESIGSPVLRKSATLGGNLLVANRCTFYNQSPDWRASIGSCLRDTGDICQVTGVSGNCYSRNVSDLAPALIALGAEITLYDSKDTRTLALEDLYAPDGIQYHRGLRPGTLLTEIRIPFQESESWFRKLRIRRSVDYSSLTIAAATRANSEFRVCVNAISMAPVMLAGDKNKMTLDEILAWFRKHCKTVNNDLLPLSYRRTMLFRWLEEWWNSTVDVPTVHGE